MGECNLTGHGGGSGGGIEAQVNEHIANTALHPRFAYGRYGASVQNKAVNVNLGFRPKMVFVSCETTAANIGQYKFMGAGNVVGFYLNMALALDGYPGLGCFATSSGQSETSRVTITATGFTVNPGYSGPGLATSAGSYFAIG